MRVEPSPVAAARQKGELALRASSGRLRACRVLLALSADYLLARGGHRAWARRARPIFRQFPRASGYRHTTTTGSTD